MGDQRGHEPTDHDGQSHQVVTEDRLEDPSDMLFNQLALFVGRPMYLGRIGVEANVQKISRLLDWSLGIKGVQVGIRPRGLAYIIQSLCSQSPDQVPTR